MKERSRPIDCIVDSLFPSFLFFSRSSSPRLSLTAISPRVDAALMAWSPLTEVFFAAENRLPPSIAWLPCTFRLLAFLLVLPPILLFVADVGGYIIFRALYQPLGRQRTYVPSSLSELSGFASVPSLPWTPPICAAHGLARTTLYLYLYRKGLSSFVYACRSLWQFSGRIARVL
jgi:hypothetical protein